eukprot:4992295-Pyramimonas_sp.AAC.1
MAVLTTYQHRSLPMPKTSSPMSITSSSAHPTHVPTDACDITEAPRNLANGHRTRTDVRNVLVGTRNVLVGARNVLVGA